MGKMYDDLILDTLKSKSVIGTDSDGKVVEGSVDLSGYLPLSGGVMLGDISIQKILKQVCDSPIPNTTVIDEYGRLYPRIDDSEGCYVCDITPPSGTDLSFTAPYDENGYDAGTTVYYRVYSFTEIACQRLTSGSYYEYSITNACAKFAVNISFSPCSYGSAGILIYHSLDGVNWSDGTYIYFSVGGVTIVDKPSGGDLNGGISYLAPNQLPGYFGGEIKNQAIRYSIVNSTLMYRDLNGADHALY